MRHSSDMTRPVNPAAGVAEDGVKLRSLNVKLFLHEPLVYLGHQVEGDDS